MPLLIQCPFYINEKRLKTFCEGGTLKSPDLRYRRFRGRVENVHNCKKS